MIYKNNKIYLNPNKDHGFLMKVITIKHKELVEEFGEVLYCEVNISSTFEILSLEYAIEDINNPAFIMGSELVLFFEKVKNSLTREII